MAKTINQLLDRMSTIHLSQMTEELGNIRQKLIYTKQSNINGGLIVVNNADHIDRLINKATMPGHVNEETAALNHAVL